ncbi:hypothetical protein Q75_08060 [Bacillus coahuilensis p1.1.43]|uniref:DUF2515 domain-containing protein n=1 Tax=Bacillus coahuilensis p1.1.43 TaxID=1150625 RepID=A0A147K8G8_9BACI|nr:DUF2515 family protein [Bacillus coahuilensis]KUP06474.1 hypothetical protein Q75_08060 [Bacillus coahuilensis p1.1.43]
MNPISRETSRSEDLLSSILSKTKKANKNNVTRTSAYLNFVKKHPEVHWAFLAHMVSRNGGYTMCDLQSFLIRELVTEKEVFPFYLFLEQANYFIFQDAYPQLLLYETCKKLNKDYFDRLEEFSVSSFMISQWKHFYQTKNSKRITYALIQNEQLMLEENVIKPFNYFTNIQKIIFFLQDRIKLSYCIFPTVSNKKHPPLYGINLHHFQEPQQRVNIGKSLYSLLYQSRYSNSFLQFAHSTPHTGSRHDYWPEVYSTIQDSTKLHSPKLVEAWSNYHHHHPVKLDWYSIHSPSKHLFEVDKMDWVDQTKYLIHYTKGLKILHQALFLSKQIGR